MKSTLLEKSGFFPEYYLNVINQSTPDELESIGKCKDDYSRVQHLNSLPFIKSSDLKIEKNLTGKSLEIATKMKESGNGAFKAKKWLDAMILYSQSLIALPLKGNGLYLFGLKLEISLICYSFRGVCFHCYCQ